MRETKKFYVSAEGETEKEYLDWLADMVCKHPQAKYNLNICVKVEQSPLRYSKTQIAFSNAIFSHICDIEGETDDHGKRFQTIIDEISYAQQKLRKYNLYYSNLSFELWIILHKEPCNTKYISNGAYLSKLNQVFHANFLSLDEFKNQKNLKACLNKFTLQDVCYAIKQAEALMKQRSQEDNPILYRKESYFKSNPALSVHSLIKEILIQCFGKKFFEVGYK